METFVMISRGRYAPGFTIAEFCVVTAVLALAIAFLYAVAAPVLRGSAKQPTCQSRLRQLGTGMAIYAQDYDWNYPCYRHDPAGNRWGEGPWPAGFRSTSFWVPLLLPYVRNNQTFHCYPDADSERNNAHLTVPNSATPWPVSYGPNLLFVTPGDYRHSQRPVSVASVDRPERKYLMGDCFSADGFDLDSIAYLRYPNYSPTEQQNGWSLAQFTAMGRVTWPVKKVEGLTRHAEGNNIMFADGHVKWLRASQIPDNDGPTGSHHAALEAVMVPWWQGTRRR
jgi:prepilin-type processing-associated H-X9-DG protein